MKQYSIDISKEDLINIDNGIHISINGLEVKSNVKVSGYGLKYNGKLQGWDTHVPLDLINEVTSPNK